MNIDDSLEVPEMKAVIDGNEVDGYRLFVMTKRSYGWTVLAMWPGLGPTVSLKRCEKRRDKWLAKHAAREIERRRTQIGTSL